jgi:isoleucyl-tRNA synthetase
MLDRWILAELDDTVRSVRNAFDGLESHTAARRLQSFVDALSNWYVRRSRPRFWAEGEGDDKRSAFTTLHETLVELAHLLAPFTPFLAEELHQRLVRKADPDAPASVHLCSYPASREDRRADDLRVSMGRVRDVVALGLQVRQSHQVKVRQVLSEAILVVAGGVDLDPYLDVIGEELNVKGVRVSNRPQDYVTFEILPNFRALGKRLGPRLPQLKAALQAENAAALYAAFERKGEITVELADGQPVLLEREDVEIRLKAQEGYAAAGQGGAVVILDTRVTPALRREGMAREVVNRIQSARKAMNLPYEARIAVTYRAGGEVDEACAEHATYIAGETLAVRFEPGIPAGEVHDTTVEDTPFTFGIERL